MSTLSWKKLRITEIMSSYWPTSAKDWVINLV